MNKTRTTTGKSDSQDSGKANPETSTTKSQAKPTAPPPDGTRETIESIAMAIVLALVFRSFVAEAFVIPTGSMAPTLVGRHKDVECPQCGYRYQAGASNEVNKEGSAIGTYVVGTTCPLCRLPTTLDLYNEPNEASFSGDRIIVGKFAYDFAAPQRWDVIVFKFPGNARDNYIKRLVGLPGETLRVVGGNVYVKPHSDANFQIARKPPEKLNVLLQPIFDSQYLSPDLLKIGWPDFWYPIEESNWKLVDEGHRFSIAAKDDKFHWLRFRHLMPDASDWETIQADQVLPALLATRPAELVTDFCAYNASFWISPGDGVLRPNSYNPQELLTQIPSKGYYEDAQGMHWVDDLALDCDVEVKSVSGELALELVRGGSHYRCTIDVATGQAQMSIVDQEGKDIPLVGDAAGAAEVLHPVAITAVKGPGTYQLRLSNVDHELLLWVNGSVVSFDQPTTYRSEELIDPYFSPTDPGDTEPALIGCKGGEMEVQRLRVYRDKYYIASSHKTGQGNNDYNGGFGENQIASILADPRDWQSSDLLASRRHVDFEIPADSFFPMGDNSPHSQDARLWADDYRTSPLPPHGPYPVPHYVKRELMVGKAFMVYWPHSWNRPYCWPNFERMKWIR